MTLSGSPPVEDGGTEPSAPPPTEAPRISEARATWQRRISYFMLVRLVILAGFTALVAVVYWAGAERPDPLYGAFVWSSLILGYVLTIVWAKALPSVSDLKRFASMQTATDILLSAVVVQMTGGTDSGFVSLYLISVLGAAIMGGPRQTNATAGACLAIYVVMSTLEGLGLVTPLGPGEFVPLPPREHWITVLRTSLGIVGVAVLSSYLNAQVSTSAHQVERLRALNDNIVRSLNSGLLTVDLQGHLRYFNPMARGILDLDDDMVGCDAETVLPGLAALDPSADGRHTLDVRTASGRRLHIGLNKASLLGTDGELQGYVVNFQDLTRLHELSQQVRRNERLAALGGLAASVAHEIRNPLAAISGSAELLDTADLSDEDRRLLAIITRESTRLSTLITDLLAFTRPRPPDRRSVAVGPIVRETADAFRSDASSARVVVDVQTDAEGEVEIDGAQLRQVLWNLLRNASEASDDGDHIRLRVFEDDRSAFITVEDEGHGISPEHLESIFDPFFTTKESGTGFGLAIVHRIIEDNGGSIVATSRPGDGTKFTIRFPRPSAPVESADSGILPL